MGVQDTFENAKSILRQPPQSHPHAYGSFGFWVVQRKPESPLGWVRATNPDYVWQMDAYAFCRDASGKRPWLATFKSLNSAVAWMLQHEREIRDLIARSDPEPVAFSSD